MIRQTLTAVAALAALTLGAEAHAADAPPPSPPPAIASVIKVPAGSDLFYLSGAMANTPNPKGGMQFVGDTEQQVTVALDHLGKVLAGQGLSFADVVNAHVYLVGDPAKGGEIDFGGLNRAWAKVFGAPDQPHKPSRTTVKVAGLVAPGALVEIDVVAAKAH
jgi:enamine deaminase RidA (YjgF/YER057c/UK114 family)